MTPDAAVLVGIGIIAGIVVGWEITRQREAYECPDCDITPDVDGGESYDYCPACGAEVETVQYRHLDQIQTFVDGIDDRTDGGDQSDA